MDHIGMILNDQECIRKLYDTYMDISPYCVHLVNDLTFTQFLYRISLSFSKYVKIHHLTEEEANKRDKRVIASIPKFSLDPLSAEAEDKVYSNN
tara:strand:+ start:349 stop:630 length:282 start_codon:yes stop_codon:yes gene_type:complete